MSGAHAAWGIEQSSDTLWIGPMRDDGMKVSDVVVSLNYDRELTDSAKVRQLMRASLIAAAPDLLTAAEALGALPDGYCFCSKDRVGDDSKTHEPECADLRSAIAKATQP